MDNGVEVIVLLGAMCALAERDPGGDQMRASQRFGDVAVDRESMNEPLGLAERKPLALNKKPREGFHRPSPLDQAPLVHSSRDPLEERTPDGIQVRTPSCDHEHRNAQRIMEPVEIDHVETGNGDPL